MPNARTVMAFLFAPLAGPVALALGAQGLLLGLWISFLPAVYIAELLFGIPTWLIFRRYTVRSWSVFAISGIVLGTLYCLTYSFAAVLAKAGGYDVYVHSFTKYWLNPGILWVDILAALLSALLFRAIVLPWRSRNNQKASLI